MIGRGRLDNRVAIVVGSGRGIGKGIAKVFGKEGAKVLAVGVHEDTGNRTVDEINKAGGIASYFRGDITSGKDMEEMARVAVERYGRIDILCQNAGVSPFVELEKMTEKDWDYANNINLRGTFLAVKACLPQMIRQKYGRILVTSSITGPRTAVPGLTHYGATKAGLNGFIKGVALELAKYGITANGVEPGTILTEVITEDPNAEAMISRNEQTIPMHKLGKPEDIAYAMVYLASDEARYVTGQTIIVDGGATLPETKA